MEITYDLATLPEAAELRSVVATPANLEGRQVLRVSLTDEVTLNGVAGVDYVDQPTFVILPVPFENGTLEVDICSGLNELAPDYARGFAGLAYRISDARDRFDGPGLARPHRPVRRHRHRGVLLEPADHPGLTEVRSLR
jgi:hypothetical protein